MTEPKHWPFYGRKKELAALTKGLHFDRISQGHPAPLFRAMKVSGRRGVGKTDLLNQMAARAPQGVPFVTLEMTGPTPQGDKRPSVAEIKRYVQTNTRNLLLAAKDAVGRHFEERLPERTHLHDDTTWFQTILTELMKARAVVVLDEFQHAGTLGLDQNVKQVIDDARLDPGGRRRFWAGKIVLMGSHQQKFDALFGPDRALYERIDGAYALQPWRLPTLLTMAGEQGILASPEKFLTLFTAYGGIPRHWERYCVEEDYASLHRIDDEKQWRQEWLALEHKFLANNRLARWDSKAYVELPDEWRDLLLWIGVRKPRGVTIKDIPADLGLGNHKEKLKALQHLRHWVELVDRNTLVGEQDASIWVISDLNTLFQIHVFREYETVIAGTDRDLEPDSIAALGRDKGTDHRQQMESLEGEGLEVLAAAFLAEQPQVGWSGSRVRHPDVPGDIDAMATRMKTGSQKKIWLGSAKRSEEEHEPAEGREEGKGLAAMKEQQDRFMDALIASAINRKDQISADNLTHAERARVLFSRVFSPELRQEYKGKGFEPVDIQDMARSFGLEPVPVTTPTRNEREDDPDPAPEPPRPGM